MANKRRKRLSLSQAPVETEETQPRYTAVRLDTENGVMQAINEVYAGLASGLADYKQSSLMLTSVGKVLNLQNLKAKVGLQISSGKSGRDSFFLRA